MHGTIKRMPERAIIQRCKEGMLMKALAMEYGISPNTFRKRLGMSGIKVRR